MNKVPLCKRVIYINTKHFLLKIEYRKYHSMMHAQLRAGHLAKSPGPLRRVCCEDPDHTCSYQQCEGQWSVPWELLASFSPWLHMGNRYRTCDMWSHNLRLGYHSHFLLYPICDSASASGQSLLGHLLPEIRAVFIEWN